MIRSMTGWGEAERETAAGRLRVEVKTVNHRYFRASIRTPAALDRYEVRIQEWLRSELPRGHVNCSVRLEGIEAEADEAPPLRLNESRARQYKEVLIALKDRLELPGEVDVGLLSRFGDLIEPDTPDAVDVDADELREVVLDAVRAATVMREDEGRRLRGELEDSIGAIERSLETVDERAPERLVAERDRLREAIAELAGDVSIDEQRLAQEIAYLAERWDIEEEQARLRSHIEGFRELLEAASEEPVGKRLGFLVQEMHREANTIGSKSNDAVIGHEVVAIKNEIERLREQIENVE